jgi:tetratricopeptide (TPR) repeat protein
VSYDLWRLEDAESYCRRSLDIRRRVHGDGPSREVADSMNYLAQVLGRMRKFDEAERLQQRVTEMRRALFGAVSEPVAAALNNQATLRKQQGDYAGAERQYREALDMLLATRGGREHRFASRSRRNIAECLLEQGRTEGVEALLIDAERTAAEFYGKDHPEVAASRHDLARLRYEERQLAEAESIARQTVELREQRRGTDHPETLQSRLLLGRILAASGRAAEAAPIVQAVLDARLVATPRVPLDIAEAQQALGEVRLASGAAAAAVDAFAAALPIYGRDLGVESRVTARCIADLTRALAASGQELTPERLARMLGR